MSEFAIKLQTAAGAKEVFRKFSVCSNDGRIRSARTKIGGGLKQIRDMGMGVPEEAAIFSSLVADPDKVVFVELRRGTSNRQLQAALTEGQQKLVNAGYDSQKAKHAHHFQQLQAQINAAIAGSANNIPGVSPRNLVINNNPPQQFEVQPIADKVDDLINSLRRV